MAKETKHQSEEKIARELGDLGRRAAFVREKIEAVREGLIRTHNKLPPDKERDRPVWKGINRAIDDLTEVMALCDLADHLAAEETSAPA